MRVLVSVVLLLYIHVDRYVCKYKSKYIIVTGNNKTITYQIDYFGRLERNINTEFRHEKQN